MRNLKKFLALVLAMVMAMSLMVTANAASKSGKFPDEDIDPGLVEAVDVLAGLEIFKGQNATGAEDADPVFAPKSEITRKEVAALIYRVFSTDVKDTKIHLYKDYANFSDVNSESWYAGYVGLCANHNIIKGSNNGRFYPDNKVTGYEVLAMILRVVGYDEEGEFTGSGWQTRVASKAALLHITDNLNTTNYAGTLNQPATREVVAELIFQTMVRVPQVTHNSLGYNDKTNLTSSQFNPTLGQEKFGLAVTGWSNDKWGDPYYTWTKGGVMVGMSDNFYYLRTNEEGRRDLNYPVYGTTSNTVATISPEPTQYYNTADIHECDVAHDLESKGFKDGSELFDLYVNSNTRITDAYRIEATDTVTRVGGQGRETKVYYKISSPFAGALRNTVTMVDTFLAKVTRVTPVVLDHNSHVVQPAQLYLDVYDRGDAVSTADRTNKMPADAAVSYTEPDERLNFINEDGTRCTNLTNGTYASKHIKTQNTNYTYAVGDYLLVRGYTDKTQGNDNMPAGQNPTAPGANTGLYHRGTQEALEKTAFETNMLAANDSTNNLTIVKVADSEQAKQSNVTWNTGSHTVGGNTKSDALTLYMDYAGRNLSNTFSWYYDQFGNLIGIGPVANTVNYGVITKLYSAFKQGTSATTGDAVAMADVTWADGTKSSVAVDTFFTTGAITGRSKLTADNYGSAMVEGAGGSNTVELDPVYDYSTVNNKVMTAEDTGAAYAPAGRHAVAGGDLYVAPVADINATYDTQNTPYFGIIFDNMFKFITTEDGVVTAIEVAGDAPADASATIKNGNSLFYNGHYHFQTTADDADPATANPNKLNKAQGNITTGTFKAGTTIWLDSNVKIVLNVGGTLKTFNGLSALPSDITLKYNSEVDWADTNGDLRADYVYLYGETTGTVTYGLFYYNGGAASWSGTEGTLAGWLNGEQTTLTFNNKDEFNTVLDSVNYRGHLFAVRLMDGIVEDVMLEDDNSASNAGNDVPQLLYADSAVYPNGANTTNTSLDSFNTKIVHTNNTSNGVTFQLGTANGNPYDANTAAVYHEDKVATTSDAAHGDSTVTYTRVTNGNQFFGTVSVDTNKDTTDGRELTYYVGANTKIFGIGTGVTYGEAVLEYLEKSPHNWVTIVYDKLTNGIIEIYVATDPNVTPSNPSTAYINDLSLTAPDYGVSNVGKWTVTVESAAKLDRGAEYSYAIMLVEKQVNGVWQTNTARTVSSGTDYDLAAATGEALMSNSATAPLTGTYRVTVTYYNASDEVVATGSVTTTL